MSRRLRRQEHERTRHECITCPERYLPGTGFPNHRPVPNPGLNVLSSPQIILFWPTRRQKKDHEEREEGTIPEIALCTNAAARFSRAIKTAPPKNPVSEGPAEARPHTHGAPANLQVLLAPTARSLFDHDNLMKQPKTRRPSSVTQGKTATARRKIVTEIQHRP